MNNNFSRWGVINGRKMEFVNDEEYYEALEDNKEKIEIKEDKDEFNGIIEISW